MYVSDTLQSMQKAFLSIVNQQVKLSEMQKKASRTDMPAHYALEAEVAMCKQIKI